MITREEINEFAQRKITGGYTTVQTMTSARSKLGLNFLINTQNAHCKRLMEIHTIWFKPNDDPNGHWRSYPCKVLVCTECKYMRIHG